jgi:hypothetical protein
VALGEREVEAEVPLADHGGVRARSQALGGVGGTVSSIASRVPAGACRRRTTRFLACSRSSVSIPAPVIVSAASTVAPPTKIAKRAKHARSWG